MNESNLWEWLRDIALPEGQYDRIESPDTASGYPDVTFQLGYTLSGTIELKYSELKKIPFPNEDKGLHKSQRRWFRRNLSYGGNCWIIAEVPPSIYVMHGSVYREFNGATREDLFELSVATLNRESPESAPKILHNLLTTYRPDK